MSETPPPIGLKRLSRSPQEILSARNFSPVVTAAAGKQGLAAPASGSSRVLPEGFKVEKDTNCGGEVRQAQGDVEEALHREIQWKLFHLGFFGSSKADDLPKRSRSHVSTPRPNFTRHISTSGFASSPRGRAPSVSSSRGTAPGRFTLDSGEIFCNDAGTSYRDSNDDNSLGSLSPPQSVGSPPEFCDFSNLWSLSGQVWELAQGPRGSAFLLERLRHSSSHEKRFLARELGLPQSLQACLANPCTSKVARALLASGIGR